MTVALSVQNITKSFGDATVVKLVSFEVPQGHFFSILGPSGSGKTSLLRMIAGFMEPSSGTVQVHGEAMQGLPPNKRPVNLIFQNLALFPTMNVEDNIAFGLKRQGIPPLEIATKVKDILERVGLPGYGKRRIHQLSGGRKLRVAIARCLVLEPAVLLLDEPLSYLDLALREQMKIELKSLQQELGITFVYATNDQSEALMMSDSVAVMKDGVFQQVDIPQKLYDTPRNAFVAQFIGQNNSWQGIIRNRSEKTVDIEVEEGEILRSHFRGQVLRDDRATLFIRPEAILINPSPDMNHINRFSATVKAVLYEGPNTNLLVQPTHLHKEFLVALPPDEALGQFKVKDTLEIGWDEQASVCFKNEERT